jgi:hypothetical protein
MGSLAENRWGCRRMRGSSTGPRVVPRPEALETMRRVTGEIPPNSTTGDGGEVGALDDGRMVPSQAPSR